MRGHGGPVFPYRKRTPGFTDEDDMITNERMTELAAMLNAGHVSMVATEIVTMPPIQPWRISSSGCLRAAFFLIWTSRKSKVRCSG
jgi:hypothetical protein